MTSETVRALMYVCAARLDPDVSAEDFLERVTLLVDAAYDSGLAEGLGEGPRRDLATLRTPAERETEPDPEPASTVPRETIGGGTETQTAEPETKPPSSGTPAEDPETKPKPNGDARADAGKERPRGGKRALSYDDRVRVLAKYEAACEGRQRAPWGLLDELAAEFGVSRSTIKAVVHKQDGL